MNTKKNGLKYSGASIWNFYAAHLTCAQVGAAIELVIYYDHNGEIPNDEMKLARICRVSGPKEYREIAGDDSNYYHLMRTVKEIIIPRIYGKGYGE
jgi:hypothetical protein